MHGARRSSKFSQIQPTTAELAALECLKKNPLTYKGKNVVATFSWLFLIRSISYLQVTITYMRVWMSLKFGQIRLLVSMARDRVIMEKNGVATFSLLFFIRSFSYLQVMMTPFKTKFCIHIIIDKFYLGIVNHSFSQICNRVIALD